MRVNKGADNGGHRATRGREKMTMARSTTLLPDHDRDLGEEGYVLVGHEAEGKLAAEAEGSLHLKISLGSQVDQGYYRQASFLEPDRSDPPSGGDTGPPVGGVSVY